MQIGRKIYYEKATGNVILTTSEMQGDVIETTIDQDFESYTALQGRLKESVGIKQMNYGEESENFAKYPFHIDATTNTIVWDVNSPIGANLEQVKELKIQQIKDFCEQEIINGFTSKAFDGVTEFPYDCKITDQSQVNGLVSIAQLRIMGLTDEPIKWKNSNQLVCEVWTPEQMLQLGLDLKRHVESKIQQKDNLKGYINTLTTIDEVNNVTWETVVA